MNYDKSIKNELNFQNKINNVLNEILLHLVRSVNNIRKSYNKFNYVLLRSKSYILYDFSYSKNSKDCKQLKIISKLFLIVKLYFSQKEIFITISLSFKHVFTSYKLCN